MAEQEPVNTRIAGRLYEAVRRVAKRRKATGSISIRQLIEEALKAHPEIKAELKQLESERTAQS